jgi:protease-4
MKSFLKYLLATVVGIILTSVIVFFIFFGIISAMMSGKEKEADIKPNSILCLKLDQPIVDRKPKIPFDFSTLRKEERIGLNELLDNIDKAAEDENISGIHLDLSYIPAGIAHIEEVRTALLDFKKSGKFITVYSEVFSQPAYYLATIADEIYFNPVGFFQFYGIRTQSPFFKNALKKLDIKPQVVRYGKYKSAIEPFTEEGYSSANREQLSRIITTIWDDILNKISAERNITPEKLNEIADNLLVRNPQAAYSFGLVDSLVYKDEVLSILKTKTGIEEAKDLNAVTLDEYSRVPKKRPYKGLAKDKIAVIYATGNIEGGESDDNNIGSDRFGREIRKARKDSSIKAIVVRINSPGGDAIASEVIWHELDLTREAKPVIVSMGNLAGSGGYYIACMADSILVQPSTITGSIGVFGMFLNTSGFFNKFGITFDTEKTNENADFMSMLRDISPVELEYWRAAIDSIYSIFVRRVEKGRPLTYAEIDEIGQGRIWSGIDAVELGLADKIGGLHDAIEMARNMAGLGDKYRIVELPKQEDPIEKLIKDLTNSAKIRALQKELGINGEYVHIYKQMMQNQGIQARMLYDISIY